jgi:hypothetical protein
MDHGTIAESGSYAALIEANGPAAHLFREFGGSTEEQEPIDQTDIPQKTKAEGTGKLEVRLTDELADSRVDLWSARSARLDLWGVKVSQQDVGLANDSVCGISPRRSFSIHLANHHSFCVYNVSVVLDPADRQARIPGALNVSRRDELR